MVVHCPHLHQLSDMGFCGFESPLSESAPMDDAKQEEGREFRLSKDDSSNTLSNQY